MKESMPAAGYRVMFMLFMAFAICCTPLAAIADDSTRPAPAGNTVSPHIAVNLFLDQQTECIVQEFLMSPIPLTWNYCWCCICNKDEYVCYPPFQEYAPDDDGDGRFDDGACAWVWEWDPCNQVMLLVCSNEACNLDESP